VIDVTTRQAGNGEEPAEEAGKIAIRGGYEMSSEVAKNRAAYGAVGEVVGRLPFEVIAKLGAEGVRELAHDLLQDAREFAERQEEGGPGRGERQPLGEELAVHLREWVGADLPVLGFFEGIGDPDVYDLSEFGVGPDVARIQSEVAKPITGAQKRNVPPDQVLAYRDARDRAQRAARETFYDGLVALVRQARQTGDETLEAAVWDVCDELDRETPDYGWRTTVEDALLAPPVSWWG